MPKAKVIISAPVAEAARSEYQLSASRLWGGRKHWSHTLDEYVGWRGRLGLIPRLVGVAAARLGVGRELIEIGQIALRDVGILHYMRAIGVTEDAIFSEVRGAKAMATGLLPFMSTKNLLCISVPFSRGLVRALILTSSIAASFSCEDLCHCRYHRIRF